MRPAALTLCLVLSLSAGCSDPTPDTGEAARQRTGGEVSPTAPPDDEERAIAATIRELMERQTRAWNDGDLAAFVGDYLDSPRMRFVSGGSVRYGSGEVLARYRRNYPDRLAMGELRFSDLDVRVLSPDFVFVFGRYRLMRAEDSPAGLFTLLFERTADGWKISHDHTSSD